MVGFRGRSFVVTCRHAMNTGPLVPLCFFVDDHSQDLVPLKAVTQVPPSIAPDDWADIALIEVDMQAAVGSKAGRAVLIDIERASIGWQDFRDTSKFVLLGYPNEKSFIEYDDQLIHSQLVTLRGAYAGPTESTSVHVMRLDDTDDLTSLSGFSGGMVLSWVERPGILPQFAFCGLAIQGTVASRSARFIEAELILHALSVW